MVVFAGFHQSSGSTVLNELKFLKVFVGYTDEQAVTVIKPGGDRIVILLLRTMNSQHSQFFDNFFYISVLFLFHLWFLQL